MQLLYWFNLTDLDILNRWGIIFNFIAGFLLAPDLIGKEKLSDFQQWLHPKIYRLRKLILITYRKVILRTYRKFSRKYDWKIFTKLRKIKNNYMFPIYILLLYYLFHAL